MMCCVCTIILCCVVVWRYVVLCIVVVCFVQRDLNSWDVSNVKSSAEMFTSATNFNVCFLCSCSLFDNWSYASRSLYVDVFCGNVVVLGCFFVVRHNFMFLYLICIRSDAGRV